MQKWLLIIFSITHVDDFTKNLIKIVNNLDDNILHLAQHQKISRVQLADIIINKSQFKSKMKYEKVKFSEIKFKEPRSRLNDLNTDLLQTKYKVNFTDIIETIERKINIIDSTLRFKMKDIVRNQENLVYFDNKIFKKLIKLAKIQIY